MPTDINSLPRLLELRLRVQPCPKNVEHKDVCVDLRIDRTEIDGPDGQVVSVRLRKATLGMDFSGLDPLPNTRFGEPRRENKVVEKQTTKVTTGLEGKVAMHAGLDITKINPINLKLSADATAEAKATTVHTSKQEIADYLVTARGGDTWVISEPRTKTSGVEEKPLDGTYLSDEILCKVTTQRGANMTSVGISASAKQCDIVLELTKGNLLHTFLNVSQEKLFKILVAKSLGLEGNKYAGIVKLSRSEITLED
jgi:hypothetical protein